MTPSAPSRPRPIARDPRSRPPRRRCCGPTASPASPARPASCQITADRLLDERATLYLIGDAKASKLLRPMFLALLSEIVDRAYERATLAGGRLELPLLLCLDEAGNVAPLAQSGRGRLDGAEPQHPARLDLSRPPAGPRPLRQAGRDGHQQPPRAMLLPGVADLETLRYFAGLIGEEEVRDLTRTTGAGGSSRSVSSRAPPAERARGAAPAPRPPRAAALRPDSRRPGCGCGCGSRTAGCARLAGPRRTRGHEGR